MPRIKQMLREGEVVRIFGVGQLISPKLIEIVGEHGDFDALWLDGEHAGMTMKEIELATLAAGPTGWTISSACRPPTTRRSCDRSRPVPAG